MSYDREILIERAQRLCDANGETRWVNWTSLGWRIERAPLDREHEAISLKIEPQV